MQRAFYSDSISNFLAQSPEEIMGILATNNTFALEGTQRDAWQEQIRILQGVLGPHQGTIFFEYSIPRMGKRIDALLLIGAVIFVLEFKVGERDFTAYALDQVCDYALDLKNFHETSHHAWIAPVLIATRAKDVTPFVVATPQDDKLLLPIKSTSDILGTVIQNILRFADGIAIDRIPWEEGRYHPTPTIVEAAMALYNGHAV